MPPPPSRTLPVSGRRSTWAPTTGPSTPSTPAQGTSAGISTPTGRSPGSATIIGKIVYFADLAHHHTYGLGISTGRVLFEKNTGAFDPVISDGKNIYLTGLTGLFGLGPLDTAKPAKKSSGSTASPGAKGTSK